jgi:hypothetical protein
MTPFITAMCCACAIGVGLSAQQTTSDRDKNMKSMTVTGCISDKDGHLLLTEELLTGDLKHDVKGDMKPASYALIGNDLTEHVGHKVEITGMTDAKTMSKDKDDVKTDTDTMAMTVVHGTIDVRSVKMISTSCP